MCTCVHMYAIVSFLMNLWAQVWTIIIMSCVELGLRCIHVHTIIYYEFVCIYTNHAHNRFTMYQVFYGLMHVFANNLLHTREHNIHISNQWNKFSVDRHRLYVNVLINTRQKITEKLNILLMRVGEGGGKKLNVSLAPGTNFQL